MGEFFFLTKTTQTTDAIDETDEPDPHATSERASERAERDAGLAYRRVAWPH